MDRSHPRPPSNVRLRAVGLSGLYPILNMYFRLRRLRITSIICIEKTNRYDPRLNLKIELVQKEQNPSDLHQWQSTIFVCNNWNYEGRYKIRVRLSSNRPFGKSSSVHVFSSHLKYNIQPKYELY